MTSIERHASVSDPRVSSKLGRIERVRRPLAVAATVGSAAVAGLGTVWLASPASNLFATSLENLVSVVLDATAVAVIAVTAGVIGVVVGGVIAIRGAVRGSRVAAVILAAVIALDLGSITTVALAGYAFGCAAVIAGIATIGVMLLRRPRLGMLLLAGLVALIVVATWWAGVTWDAVVAFAFAFAGALAAQATQLSVVAIVLASTLLWAATAAANVTGGGSGVFETWLVHHRRAITILAALGPVPYALARVTWLTPWPVFGPGREDLTAPVLVTGLVLGSGAVAAGILTLGLILPWGRVFPRWMPGVGGTPVPVRVAAIPGFAAAGILIVAAPAMLVAEIGGRGSPLELLLLNLVLPLWFWGPMLALAVWAYLAWRRRGCR